jgi:hypothetical protein
VYVQLVMIARDLTGDDVVPDNSTIQMDYDFTIAV